MPEEVGNAAVIDDVTVFAHASREKDILKVMISIVVPDEYKNPRSYLFDQEKEYFQRGIYLTSQNGERYEPDDELRRSRDDGIQTFYFHVPEDMDELKLVIPQILFERDYSEGNIKITVPKEKKETHIYKKVELGSHSISLERASWISAGSEMLPDDFKSFDSLMIDASATAEKGSRQNVLRIIPDIKVVDSLFQTGPVSQSIYADFWDPNQHNGYALCNFDNMQETKKIILDFTAEISMTEPWVIALDEE